MRLILAIAPPPEDGDNLDITAGIRKPGYGGQLLPGEFRHAQLCNPGKNPAERRSRVFEQQIENFEKMGYVMRSTRAHERGAFEKENQVYSAEEQAALAMINYEEKAAKEK